MFANLYSRDNQLWPFLFYGVGGLWIVAEAIGAMDPNLAASIGITVLLQTKIRAILIILAAIGGKMGNSPAPGVSKTGQPN